MNRSSKATLAGGLAVVLLAGGATTFARWYAEDSMTVANVQSGELSFEATDADWQINSLESAEPSKDFDPVTDMIVPGDVVTYTTVITPTLVGENLEATFTAELVDLPAAAPIGVEVDVFDADNAEVSILTEADDQAEFTAQVTITFDEYNNGEMWNEQLQNKTINLNNLTLTLEQNER